MRKLSCHWLLLHSTMFQFFHQILGTQQPPKSNHTAPFRFLLVNVWCLKYLNLPSSSSSASTDLSQWTAFLSSDLLVHYKSIYEIAQQIVINCRWLRRLTLISNQNSDNFPSLVIKCVIYHLIHVISLCCYLFSGSTWFSALVCFLADISRWGWIRGFLCFAININFLLSEWVLLW